MAPSVYFAAAAIAGIAAFAAAPDTHPEEAAIRRHIESTYFDGAPVTGAVNFPGVRWVGTGSGAAVRQGRDKTMTDHTQGEK